MPDALKRQTAPWWAAAVFLGLNILQGWLGQQAQQEAQRASREAIARVEKAADSREFNQGEAVGVLLSALADCQKDQDQ